MTRNRYNDLRYKLKDEFKKLPQNDYGLMDGVGNWVVQSGIRLRSQHIEIVCNVFGSVPYPYQANDRIIILDYLATHRFGQFLKDKKL